MGLYENEPKIYTRENGQPGGLFPVLLESLAEREGWDLEYQACQWSECLTQLERGELDLMPDVALTRERRERFREGQGFLCSPPVPAAECPWT